MSNTENPLHQFRSYSYHHILIACDTTAAAEAVSGLGSNVTGNIGDFNDQVFQHHGAERGVVARPIADGNYVVVINGARDSEFIITDAKWSTLVIPAVFSKGVETIHATTMATEGSMEILEPKGIRFINVINDVGNKLLTGPTGITWVLKTIFIGQTDGGKPRFLTKYKPVMLFMANITGSFDVGGAEYTFDFIGQTNGAAKIPQFSDLKIPSIPIPKEKNTLKEIFGYLTSTIQLEYDDFLIETEQVDIPGRNIKYKIELEKDTYATDEYRIDDLLLQNKGSYNFGRKVTIEQAITHLMQQCTKVKIDASGNPKYIFKIHSTLKTAKKTATVTYYVRRYVQPESVVIDKDNINAPTDGNTLNYDYIYSGNNIDILEFDIKMQLGLAFFQLLESTQTLRDSQKAQHNSGDDEQDRKKQNEKKNNEELDKKTTNYKSSTNVEQKSNEFRIKYPSAQYRKIFQKNSNSGLTASDFQSALAQHAELETLESKITILGNPELMSDLNILPSDVNVVDAPISNTTVMKNWLHVPMFCKINIRMPKSSSLTVDVGSSFSEPFWYDGYYTILAVEQVFKNGTFTQELDLLSVPQKTTE